jgi:hypothetical protein
MQWLVTGAQPNDSLFFHCTFSLLFSFYQQGIKDPLDSGHGGQTKDLDGDEADGYDEGVLLPHHADLVVNMEPIYQLFIPLISKRRATSSTM